MALSETLSETSICNQALGRLGANRIPDGESVETSTTVQAIQCRLHYEQTRDALLRSHQWRFASARASLSQDTTDPDFEWDNQFDLPDDFLKLKSIYDNTLIRNTRHSFAIEGQILLTNEGSVNLRYVKKVTDPTEFDPLFIEVFVLLLADKLIGPLVGGDPRIQEKLDKALAELIPAVRTLDRQETNTLGRADEFTWTDVRQTRGGRIDSRLGST